MRSVGLPPHGPGEREAQDQFFDARSHGTSSVGMSRDNSMSGVPHVQPPSLKDGEAASDAASLNTYQVNPNELTGSGGSVKSADVQSGAAQGLSPRQQPTAREAIEMKSEASTAPMATPVPPSILDDPSIDPLGDAVPMGNISQLAAASGDSHLWWNSEAGKGSPTKAEPAPPPVGLSGDASLLSLGDDVGAPVSDPFAAGSPDLPVLAQDAWGPSQGGVQASESNLMDAEDPQSAAADSTGPEPAPGSISRPANVPPVGLDSLKDSSASTTSDAHVPLPSPVRNLSGTLEDAIAQENMTGLFGGLQMGDDADSSTATAQPLADIKGPEASLSATEPSAASPPSPPIAPSSPDHASTPPATEAGSKPLTVLTGGTSEAASRAITAPKSSAQPVVESNGVAGKRTVRLPVSVPASANERISPDSPPPRPPVATGAPRVSLSSQTHAAASGLSGVPETGAAPNGSGPGALSSQVSLDSPDDDSTAWLRSKSRHYFIISNGGRPIYTRHGQANDAAAVSALFFGLASLAHDALGELPHIFRAGDLTLALRARRLKPESPRAPRSSALTRQPYSSPAQNEAAASGTALSNVAMITACSCMEHLPDSVLQVHLELLQLQLLVWTSGKYERVLVDNPTLDTSAALSGTAASFESLLSRLGNCMDFLLQAVETLRIRPIVRGAAEASLRQAVVDSDGVFGVVACDHQLVAMCCHPQLALAHRPHAWDILLLLNFVISNSSYRTQLSGQQAWVPFCLPKSSPHCFHFVYVHHPKQESPLYVALVCRSQQDFFTVHGVREPLMATLSSTGVLEVRTQLPAQTIYAVKEVYAKHLFDVSVPKDYCQVVLGCARRASMHVIKICMQEAEHNACTSPFSHRMHIADIPLSDRLRHVQGALWHITLSRCETGAFTQTAFSPLLATEEDRQDAVQDCMRMHASMWSAAAVSKSVHPSPSPDL